MSPRLRVGEGSRSGLVFSMWHAMGDMEGVASYGGMQDVASYGGMLGLGAKQPVRWLMPGDPAKRPHS